MTRLSEYSAHPRIPAKTSLAFAGPIYSSETRVDIALLTSALFLQRFGLPLGETFLSFDLVAAACILVHQFLSGKLLIQNDRLLWFLATGLAATCSLLLNFDSMMLTSYFLFLLLCYLFLLRRPSTPDRYRSMLHAFQILVVILSCFAIAQFAAQFVVDGRKLIMFYGIIPDVFISAGVNTIIEIKGSSILKANGIFLGEPSHLSQITALGILIEVLEFRRPQYLIAMALGFLLAYSGTGLMILGLFLPLAGLRHGRVALSVLFVVMFALGLLATGVIDQSVFVVRTGEFGQPGTSGFQHFTAPFWLAAKFFDTASLQALLVGVGPGTAKTFGDTWYGHGMSGWSKQLYEYGVLGSFIFVCFAASCLRRSRCPGLLLAALVYYDLFIASVFMPWVAIITIVLCTLHGPELRHGRIGKTANQYRSSLVTGPVPG